MKSKILCLMDVLTGKVAEFVPWTPVKIAWIGAVNKYLNFIINYERRIVMFFICKIVHMKVVKANHKV